MEGLLRAFCVAQRRQFELAVNGVFWRTTVFFVLVLRQQDCVLQPCISPKSTIHGQRFRNGFKLAPLSYQKIQTKLQSNVAKGSKRFLVYVCLVYV